MPRFRRFEDVPVWRDGRELVKAVYRVTRYPGFTEDHSLKDQIRRAAVSITSNIAEGHERGTTPDLILFLYYAKGSAGEVRSQLYNAEDAGYLNHAEAEELRGKAAGIGRQIYGWVTSMQAPDFARGPAYHKAPMLAERKWQRTLERFGIVRMPSGRFEQVRENSAEYEADDADTEGTVDGRSGEPTE